MALTKCPECGLQVSDKAVACPHCGYPLCGDAQPIKSPKRSNRRKRLPNGFGSIVKLNGRNLRNPFWARVCVGKDEFAKPILKPLKPRAYFATYNDAYAALLDYNRNPYDLANDLTVKELYDKWSAQYYPGLSAQAQRTLKSAWSYCSSIADMRARDVRARHIKGVMENGYRIEYKGPRKGEKIHPTAGLQIRIKTVFNMMLDYGVEYELLDKNYARTFDISSTLASEQRAATKGHIAFTEDEVAKLWDNVDKVKYVDWILIQCYMGWRPQELATLRLEEVNIEKWYMRAGMKTDAGKQRIVPIHSKIRPLVQRCYDFAESIGSEYLLNDKPQGSRSWEVSYNKYRSRFAKVIEQLDLNPLHRPHDPRKTFVTRGKKAEMDEYALKKMVGHTIEDITEAVYTERDIEWLRADLEKLP